MLDSKAINALASLSDNPIVRQLPTNYNKTPSLRFRWHNQLEDRKSTASLCGIWWVAKDRKQEIKKPAEFHLN